MSQSNSDMCLTIALDVRMARLIRESEAHKGQMGMWLRYREAINLLQEAKENL